MGVYAKSIWKTLRRLKKSCTVVHDIMKALMNLPYMDAVSSVLNLVKGNLRFNYTSTPKVCLPLLK